MTITAAASRRALSVQVRRKGRPLTHKMVWIAAAFSTSTHAWQMAPTTNPMGGKRHCSGRLQRYNQNIFVNSANVISPPWIDSKNPRTTTTTSRLYSSSNKNNNNKNDELFGFRRAAKSAARKVLPTKWFGTKKEKEALERKQIVKDRVQGELDQMLKGAPLPLKLFGKYVAAPMMGKIASKVAEAGLQQQEAMEQIMDQAREVLLSNEEITSLLGTPLQIGAPFSQMSSTTVINGRRQMRTEFAVEVAGPYQNGVCRIVATNEGIGQLLVESNGKVYNLNLTSQGKMSSKSSFKRNPSRDYNSGNDDDNIIEAEIIDKDTKR